MLAELGLDRGEDRLAVRVAALVVAHLAQLGGQRSSRRSHLRRGEVLVARDREASRCRSRGARGRPRGDGRRRCERLELRDQVLGGAPAAREELLHQLRGVVARHAPAVDRVVDDLLQPVAGEHHDLARVE